MIPENVLLVRTNLSPIKYVEGVKHRPFFGFACLITNLKSGPMAEAAMLTWLCAGGTTRGRC